MLKSLKVRVLLSTTPSNVFTYSHYVLETARTVITKDSKLLSKQEVDVLEAFSKLSCEQILTAIIFSLMSHRSRALLSCSFGSSQTKAMASRYFTCKIRERDKRQ